MLSLEYVALDLYSSNQAYVNSLAVQDSLAVTYTFWDESTQSFAQIGVSGLAAIAAADWVQFEQEIQAYFGFSPDLNDQLQAAGVETVTLAG